MLHEQSVDFAKMMESVVTYKPARELIRKVHVDFVVEVDASIVGKKIQFRSCWRERNIVSTCKVKANIQQVTYGTATKRRT